MSRSTVGFGQNLAFYKRPFFETIKPSRVTIETLEGEPVTFIVNPDLAEGLYQMLLAIPEFRSRYKPVHDGKEGRVTK